jgi:hypothetical protein
MPRQVLERTQLALFASPVGLYYLTDLAAAFHGTDIASQWALVRDDWRASRLCTCTDIHLEWMMATGTTGDQATIRSVENQ